MANFTFDPVTHIYRLGDVILPSVTQIIKGVGLYEVSPFSTGPELGKRVHTAIEQFNRGITDRDFIEPEVLPYLAAWEQFIAVTEYKSQHHEELMYSPTLRFAGTMDDFGVGVFDKTQRRIQALLDFKTGVPHPSHNLQLCAYRGLLHECYGVAPDKLFTLYLRKDGKYRLVECKPEHILNNWNLFKQTINIYNWKMNNGLVNQNQEETFYE